MQFNRLVGALRPSATAVVAVLAFAQPLVADEPLLDPGPDREKLVLVQGWSRQELGQISVQFLEMYRYVAPIYSQLRVDDFDGELVLISFPRELPWDVFLFFVNYIHYPIGYDLSSRDIAVLGLASLEDGEFPASAGLGLFYVPDNDEEFDQVFVESEDGRNFRISFTDLEWDPVDEPRQSAKLGQLILHAR